MIHNTAIIHPGAEIAPEVTVGPYAVIGEHVRIGSGTSIGPHAVIEGWTEIGRDNRIFQFASVGAVPQDLKYHGEKAWLRMGDRNTVREFASLHIGTDDGGNETIVGSDCLFMANSHVAHDCRVGDGVIVANSGTLAGHVTVDDFSIIGGLCAIHQFCRIGQHVMLSGGTMINQDVAPYTIAQGVPGRPIGINQIGLQRRGFSDEAIRGLKKAYKTIYRSGLKLSEALEQVDAQWGKVPEVQTMVAFARSSSRGLAR